MIKICPQKTFSLLLLIAYSAIAVFSFAFLTYEMNSSFCPVSAMFGSKNCASAKTSAVPNLHIAAYAVFSQLDRIGYSALLAVVFLFFVIVLSAVITSTSPPLLRRAHSGRTLEFLTPQKQKILHWLALHEISPTHI